MAGAVVLLDGPPIIDPVLLELGRAHLDAVRRTRSLHNGDTLCWVGPAHTGGIAVVRGRYFDMLATCDAIRAEGLDGPRRHRAVEVAGGDPCSSGLGRAAAVGVTVLATRPVGERRVLVVGRRSQRVATDAGRWHLVPSGMLELDRSGHGAHLATTIATELAEELGVTVRPDAVEARAQVLGLAHDLGRLRPDLVVRIDLTEDDLTEDDLTGAELGFEPPRGGEFDDFEQVELSVPALDGFLRSRPSDRITPAAAGALQLLRDQLMS
jgi:8-oxo-dGTP pyrophosphatase MutT (NUDIX family)